MCIFLPGSGESLFCTGTPGLRYLGVLCINIHCQLSPATQAKESSDLVEMQPRKSLDSQEVVRLREKLSVFNRKIRKYQLISANLTPFSFIFYQFHWVVTVLTLLIRLRCWCFQYIVFLVCFYSLGANQIYKLSMKFCSSVCCLLADLVWKKKLEKENNPLNWFLPTAPCSSCYISLCKMELFCGKIGKNGANVVLNREFVWGLQRYRSDIT